MRNWRFSALRVATSSTYSLWNPLIWLASGGGKPENFRVAFVVLLTLFVAIRMIVVYVIAQCYLDHAWSAAVASRRS